MLDWLIWLSIPKVNAEWENPESKRKGITIYSPSGNMLCDTNERPLQSFKTTFHPSEIPDCQLRSNMFLNKRSIEIQTS